MSFSFNTVMASASNSPRTKVSVKYCQNIRTNDGFSLIGILMSIEGRNGYSRLAKAKISLWK